MRSNVDAGSFGGRMVEAETAVAAAMVGVPVHTIRNWASRGFLQPLRTQGHKTIYAMDAVAKVAASFGYLPDLRQEHGDCCAPHCRAPAWPDVPVPLCQKHAIAIWLHVGDEWQRRVSGGGTGEWNPQADHAGSQQPVVYFVKIGDRVKIGTTINLPRRLAVLATHAQDKPQVLLVVAGDRDDEKRVHELFRADRVRGEWFRLSGAMKTFISERSGEDIRDVHRKVAPPATL